MEKIPAKDISDAIGLRLCGPDILVSNVSQLTDIKPNSIVFAKKFSEEYKCLLNRHPDVLAIVVEAYNNQLSCSYIVSPNPRLDYIRVIRKFFMPDMEGDFIHPSAVISEKAHIGKNVYIGSNCYISADCTIGDNTIIHPNVVIDSRVTIGCNCEIKSGAVIGQSGFGFERDNDGIPIHFPHLGGVVIMDNVYIGANTCIDRGTLGDTIIESNVKIDNLVHIAHNCHIGFGSFVIAGAVLGGGTFVENNCWLAPNISVKEQTRVGKDSLIGLGAVVIRNVEESSIMIGNPAKKLEK